MSDLGVMIYQLGGLFTGIINVYIWVIIVTAFLSFVNPDPFNPIVQFLYRVTNPAYSMVRRYMKTNFSGIDVAPLVIVFGLQVVIILLNFVFTSLARSL